MAARSPLLALGWAALVPVVAPPCLAVVWLMTATRGFTGWRFTEQWALAIVLVAAVVGAGTVVDALRRGRGSAAVGGLLLVMTSTWPILATIDPVSPALGPVLTGLALLLPVGLAQWGSAQVPRRVVAVLGGLALALQAVGYSPAYDVDCVVRCVGGDPVVPGIVSWVVLVSSLVAAVASLLVAATSPATSVRTAAVLACGLFVVRALVWGPTPADGARLLLPLAPLFVMGVDAAWAGARRRRARRWVQRLVDELGPSGTDRAATSWRFAVPGHKDVWVDAGGHRVSASRLAEDVEVRTDAGHVVARGAAPAPGERPADRQPAGLVDRTMLRILVENARSAALLRADARELAASRRRIVEMADAEARRIEHDLHDGAQQTLVGSLFHVSRARRSSGLPEHDALLAEVERDLRHALEGLQEVAHGAFPRLLVDEGVGVALADARLERGAVRVTRDGWGPDVPTSIAVAAYRLAVAASSTATATIEVTLGRDVLGRRAVCVIAPGVEEQDERVRRALERAAAVGGVVEARRDGEAWVAEVTFT